MITNGIEDSFNGNYTDYFKSNRAQGVLVMPALFKCINENQLFMHNIKINLE